MIISSVLRASAVGFIATAIGLLASAFCRVMSGYMDDKTINKGKDTRDAVADKVQHSGVSGEDVAFAVQQTFACWATDFIDPFVGAWVQRRFGDKNPTGTLTHALKGEVVGDSAAFFLFLTMQQWCPAPVHYLRHLAQRFYQQQEVQGQSPATVQEVIGLQHYQSNNFARSVTISLCSVASNVAFQKWAGNKNPLAAITASKLVGAGVTTAVVLGSRLAFPQATHALDVTMDRKLITPLAHKIQHVLGITAPEKGEGREGRATHAERLCQTCPVRTNTRGC